MSPSRPLVFLSFLLAASAPGCDQGTSARGDGSRCFEDLDCLSGACRSELCVPVCASGSECESGVCLTDGACAPRCTSTRSGYMGTACIDGALLSCDALDASFCDVCEGSCPGMRCEAEVGCAPLSDVDGPCAQDSDCRTGNCSIFAGVCRVPLETECDETNCDLCIRAGEWSYCSRECGADFEGYPACPGERCVGQPAQDFFYCRPACGGDCPGSCDVTSTGSIRYCDGSSWSVDSPPRPTLAYCNYTTQCEDGATCLTHPSCDSRAFDCLGNKGYCTTACGSDADCGAGGACVNIECPEGVTEGCGARCLPTCDPEESSDCRDIVDADCRELTGADGGAKAVCDPRNRDGQSCRSGLQCQSATCNSMSRCAPAGGQANGAACSSDTDCRSANCQGGMCRGRALRGDPCSVPADCSAGTCVSGVCD